MYLYCLKQEAEISDKDIVCYNLLFETIDGKLYTPDQYKEVQIGEEVEAEGKEYIFTISDEQVHKIFYGEDIMGVWQGFIHGCTNPDIFLYPNVEPIERILGKKMKSYVIAECIIPKGTPHYRSFNGKEICAKKIQYIKEAIKWERIIMP